MSNRFKKLGDSLPITQLQEPEGGWEEHDRKIREQRRRENDAARLVNETQRRRALVGFGVPVKDAERVYVDGLDDTLPLVACKEQIEKDPHGILVLAGSVGCGKTTAAAWWLCQPGPDSEYLKLTNPVFLPTYRMERLNRYSDESMVPVEKSRRLVIDDLGTEYADKKDHFVTLIRAIVDYRYSQMLPLVITTNLNSKEFAKRYGERTIDRLREVGTFKDIQAPSLRGKQ